MNLSEPVRLSAAGLAYLQAKIDKLNRRVAGAFPVEIITAPVTYTWAYLKDAISGKELKAPSLLSPEELAENKARGFHCRIDRVEPWFDVQVSLNAPKIEGHQLVARLEHLSEGNVVYGVPGCSVPVPVSARSAKPLCQHCLTIRRRNDTFVLHDGSQYVQVGRNCIADYLRDPAAAERLLDWTAIVQSVTGAIQESVSLHANGAGGRWYWAFNRVVALAIRYADKFGWLSAKQAAEQERSSSASSLLSTLCTTFNRPLWLADVQAEADADVDNPESEANKVVRWILEVLANKPEVEVSDYESNLVVLAKSGAVHSGQFALAASAFRAYRAAIAPRPAAKPAGQTGPTGQHLGEVGKRDVFTLECTDVKSLGVGDYGERFLIKFRDAAGNCVVWFTGEGGFDAKFGETYTVKATVKEHGEFGGVRQTVVSRLAEYVPEEPKPVRLKKDGTPYAARKSKKAAEPLPSVLGDVVKSNYGVQS